MGKGRRNGICFHFWMRNKTWLRAIKKTPKSVTYNSSCRPHWRVATWAIRRVVRLPSRELSYKCGVNFCSATFGGILWQARKNHLRVHYWGEEGRKAKAAKWTQRPALLFSLLTFESSLQVVERYQCNLRKREDFLKLYTARYNLFLRPWTENLLEMYLRRQAASDYGLPAAKTLSLTNLYAP